MQSKHLLLLVAINFCSKAFLHYKCVCMCERIGENLSHFVSFTRREILRMYVLLHQCLNAGMYVCVQLIYIYYIDVRVKSAKPCTNFPTFQPQYAHKHTQLSAQAIATYLYSHCVFSSFRMWQSP